MGVIQTIVMLLLSGTASPLCATCQVHVFCSRGESLTDQHLSIMMEAKEEYCHFRIPNMPYTGRCTDVSSVTLINATCLRLETMDLDLRDLILEYGTTHIGKSAQSLLAGCCDSSPNDKTRGLIIGLVVSAVVTLSSVAYRCIKRRNNLPGTKKEESDTPREQPTDREEAKARDEPKSF
uniref:Uncharacterized protein n=1 Tax=Xenopus tropicalis TaxID=8364 RepID=A0A803JD36_XENTR